MTKKLSETFDTPGCGYLVDEFHAYEVQGADILAWKKQAEELEAELREYRKAVTLYLDCHLCNVSVHSCACSLQAEKALQSGDNASALVREWVEMRRDLNTYVRAAGRFQLANEVCVILEEEFERGSPRVGKLRQLIKDWRAARNKMAGKE